MHNLLLVYVVLALTGDFLAYSNLTKNKMVMTRVPSNLLCQSLDCRANRNFLNSYLVGLTWFRTHRNQTWTQKPELLCLGSSQNLLDWVLIPHPYLRTNQCQFWLSKAKIIGMRLLEHETSIFIIGRWHGSVNSRVQNINIHKTRVTLGISGTYHRVGKR
jgi:hypothetical protein